MLKVQDKPFTNIEDITKINIATKNVVFCTSLPAGINVCGHSADSCVHSIILVYSVEVVTAT